METNNVLTVEGKEYKKVAVSLSVSPNFVGGSVQGSVSMRCTPYDDNGEAVDGHDRTLFIPNVYESTDPDVIEALNTIQGALQKLIIAKNL